MIEEPLTPEQRTALDAIKRSRGECPSAETLVEYEALADDERATHPADRHVSICSRCQLVLLHAAEPAASTGSRLRWALPIAALLILGVAVSMVMRGGGPPVEPPDTVRGTEIQAMSPIGAVDTVSAFTWQSPIRAERYRVVVTRGSDRVWTGEATAPRIEAPSGVFDENVEYRWVVEAIDREGDVRMTSPPRAFTIRRAP